MLVHQLFSCLHQHFEMAIQTEGYTSEHTVPQLAVKNAGTGWHYIITM